MGRAQVISRDATWLATVFIWRARLRRCRRFDSAVRDGCTRRAERPRAQLRMQTHTQTRRKPGGVAVGSGALAQVYQRSRLLPCKGLVSAKQPVNRRKSLTADMSGGTQQIEFFNVHRYSNAGRLGFDSDNPLMRKRHGGSTQRVRSTRERGPGSR